MFYYLYYIFFYFENLFVFIYGESDLSISTSRKQCKGIYQSYTLFKLEITRTEFLREFYQIYEEKVELRLRA